MTTILVTGNTYPVKDSIKALGGRWDPAAKGWRVPADRAPEAQALVARAPGKAFAGTVRRSTGGRCRECHGTLVDARHHRAMGGLCGECAFDEYDC